MALSMTIDTIYQAVFRNHMDWNLGVTLGYAFALIDQPDVFASGGWIWFFPGLLYLFLVVLYANSGFVIKLAHRFAFGFQWFNRHMDIETKPLQAIGRVAGVIVALGYWIWILAI
jgi:hypothetical protein